MIEVGGFDAQRRFGLPPDSFPFRSRYVDAGGARLHFIDEGAGPPLLMLHGNPTWSFVYRHLIGALRDRFRCVAIDLAGFGLSRAPAGFSYRAADQARIVALALERLDLREATLVAHDWGGPIGIAAAGATGERIVRLCLGNTWAWPVNGDLHFEWFSRLLGGPLGRWAARRHAILVNVLMPATMRRRTLEADEMAAYRAPFADPASRTPTHVLPDEIRRAGAWLDAVERTVAGFRGPVHLIWPDRDIAFREKELAHWRTLLPQATVTRLANCGHYLWEDAPQECLDALVGFLAASGAGAGNRGARVQTGCTGRDAIV